MSLFELLCKLRDSLLAGLGRSDLRDFLAFDPEVDSIAEAVNEPVSGDIEVSSYLGNRVTCFAFQDAFEHHS